MGPLSASADAYAEGDIGPWLPHLAAIPYVPEVALRVIQRAVWGWELLGLVAVGRYFAFADVSPLTALPGTPSLLVERVPACLTSAFATARLGPDLLAALPSLDGAA